MTKRTELGESLNMKINFIPKGKDNRPGKRKESLQFITIHNTDNLNATAGAENHSKFVTEKGYYIWNEEKHWVSWHYTVDDKMVIKQLPLDETAFHAGYRANHSSIAIEICMNKGIDQNAANDRAARLCAILLYDFHWGLTSIKSHHDWTEKNCPQLLLNANESDGSWKGFIKKVNSYLDSLNGANIRDDRYFDNDIEYNWYLCLDGEKI